MKYFLKFKFVLIIILLLTLLNTICFFPLINFKNSSHFFYKEIIYTHISHNLINSDKFKTIFNVFDYVYFNVDDEYSASFNIVDTGTSFPVVRKFTRCCFSIIRTGLINGADNIDAAVAAANPGSPLFPVTAV